MNPRRNAHTWEVSPAKRFAHSWERPGPVPGEPDDDGFWGDFSDSDLEQDEESTPGQELVSKMVRMHLLNKISAEDCCTTLFYAARAGVVEAERFALSPGSSSGHYARKMRSVLGYDDSPHLYTFKYPGHCKHALSRVTHTGFCIPLHEQIAADLDSNVECRTRLMEILQENTLPPIYYEHPIVKAFPDERIMPIALYLDAVPWSLTDSVIGWWAINLITGRRFCWAVLRKQNACRCGCRHWDSVFVFLQLTLWSLTALKEARHPDRRHDGLPFSEPHRLAKAGSAMHMRCCCLYIKGDWSEFSSTLGLPTWQSGIRPCYCCNGQGTDCMVVAGNTSTALRWRPNTDDDYLEDCRRCSRRVNIATDELRDRIANRMRYDKRGAGVHGRALTARFPDLALEVGDRLEPSAELPDVGLFDEASTPFVALFWRVSEESITRRPNPLFIFGLLLGLGVSAARSLAIDTLHSMHLGVLKIWGKICVWEILLSGVFGTTGAADENLATAVLAFRASLMNWYKQTS